MAHKAAKPVPGQDDILDRKKGGGTKIVMSETEYWLDRPTAGQLLDLRLALIDINEERRDLVEVSETLVEGIDDDLDDEAKAEAAIARRAAARTLSKPDMQRDILNWEFESYGKWLVRVFEELGGYEDMVPADMAPWLFEMSLLTDLMAHWRGVPLARGS